MGTQGNPVGMSHGVIVALPGPKTLSLLGLICSIRNFNTQNQLKGEHNPDEE